MNEQFQHLRAFRQGIVSTRTVNNFLAENGPKPMAVYDEKGENEIYKTQIDWTTLAAIKGLVFGIYLEMRHDGAEPLAKGILLEEGVRQYLTTRHRDYLAEFDTKWNFTPSVTPEVEANLIVI